MRIFSTQLIFLVLILCSCKGGVDKPTQQDSTPDFLADTILKDSIVSSELELPRYPTAESQIHKMKSSNHWEKYEKGILPQMTEDAPEYCEKILQAEGKRFIIVDKAKMKLFLYDPYGNIEKSYGIACAKNYGTKHKKGDSRTTEGIFSVKGVFDSREWLFTDDNGYTSPKKGQFGPRFIRLTIPYIGIHGTGSPGSIGKRCSHGCIRVTNDNIMELVNYVEEGMPVIISPGPRDMAVNQREGVSVLSVSTEPGSPKAVAGNYQGTLPSTTIENKGTENIEEGHNQNVESDNDVTTDNQTDKEVKTSSSELRENEREIEEPATDPSIDSK